MSGIDRQAKTVVVTGAASGIGKAVAARFHAEGWNVASMDLQSDEGTGHPPLDLFRVGDVSVPEDVRGLFEALAGKYGQVDALVNNAAVQICKPLAEMSHEEWTRTLDVNLTGAYLTLRHGFPLMAEHGGAIVNISSVHAIATSAHIAAYAATKGALLAMTRALAIELAPHAIRVNAVLPGAVDTEMLRDGLRRGHVQGATTDDLVEALSRRHVMGRVGRPEEIASMVFMLADPTQSGFITGQGFVVDGGATARLSTE